MSSQILSIGSTILAFIVSSISAYLFSLEKISFEALVWIVIGSIAVMMIMIYQEIHKELENQKWEQKRLNEKLKIYKRLESIENRLKK